jgi:hypothetical protein
MLGFANMNGTWDLGPHVNWPLDLKNIKYGQVFMKMSHAFKILHGPHNVPTLVLTSFECSGLFINIGKCFNACHIRFVGNYIGTLGNPLGTFKIPHKSGFGGLLISTN